MTDTSATPDIETQDRRQVVASSDVGPESFSPLLGDRATTNRVGMAAGIAKRTAGLALLLVVVFLWTASNFLASTIFADDSYPKPFFVTFTNTSVFVIPLIWIFGKRATRIWLSGRKITRDTLWEAVHYPQENAPDSSPVKPDDTVETMSENYDLLPSPNLGLRSTARLSLEFCVLWFLANYFALGCLQFTTVASTTILTSTSSIWTLLFGAAIRVETFTMRKLLGVLASLIGIMLVSRVDISGNSDGNRGTFPHKSQGELAIGDSMAAFSAILYGVYTIVMKKRVGGEDAVNMPIFFGLVGLWNMVLLWPGFLILHLTGAEPFQLPPTSRIWAIVMINALSSLLSDICWAYAMLLTSPLVVTVGLSLTIPLSLVGQMVLDGQYSSLEYWIGACIVLCSFIFINHESEVEGTNTGLEGYTQVLDNAPHAIA